MCRDDLQTQVAYSDYTYVPQKPVESLLDCPIPKFSLGFTDDEDSPPRKSCQPSYPCQSVPDRGTQLWEWPPLYTLPQFENVATPAPITSVDYSEFFATDRVFEDRDDIIAWAKGEAKKLNFMLVNFRVDRGTKGRRPVTWLACQRRGKSTPTKSPSEKVKSRVRQCDCPFLIQVFEEPLDRWNIVVRKGTHNHVISDNLHGNAYAGHPTKEELKLMKEMAEVHVQPRYVLGMLSSPDNVTSIKQIYNINQKFRREGMEGRTVVQELFKKCKENEYYVEYTSDPETNKIKDVFFASPDGIRLLRAFPYVILLDSTYSTNV